MIQLDFDGRLTVQITREQLEGWSGRSLTDDQVVRLDEAIPDSSIPSAIDTLVHALGVAWAGGDDE